MQLTAAIVFGSFRPLSADPARTCAKPKGYFVERPMSLACPRPQCFAALIARVSAGALCNRSVAHVKCAMLDPCEHRDNKRLCQNECDA